MSISRRRFLEGAALGAGALALPRGLAAFPSQTRSLRILVLGGTGFIGPHMVRRALERGHQITLFNRGRSNTHLFPQVEKLVGDRNGQLDALVGREWDAVIDNSGYYPSHVRQSAELLAGSVNHYLYTSTIDAYRDFRVDGITESYPLGRRPEGAPERPQEYYGPLKAECEDAVREFFPTNNTRVRPGWIAGPGDNNHLFTYWVMRVVRGGEMLAPGEPSDPMQLTEVRDLANWYVYILERSIMGAYTAVGPVTNMGAMLADIQAAVGSDTSFTWVDADFLLERDIKPWTNIPLWWPPRNDWAPRSFGGNLGGVGAFTIDGSAARAQGLTHISMRRMARDTYDWYRETFEGWPEDRRPGLTAAREAELLAEWRGR